MKSFMTRMISAAAVAMALTSVSNVTAEEGLIVDIDAKYNTPANPVEVFLPAGSYQLMPVGPSEGARFTARNPWNGMVRGCLDNGMCQYGWQHGGLVYSDEVTIYDTVSHYYYPLDFYACESAQTYNRSFVAETGFQFLAFKTPELALAHHQIARQDCVFTTDSDGFVSFADGDRIHGDNKGGSSFKLVPVNPVIDAEIDIKPGSERNPLNINGHGKIPVAILGSAEFDVTYVDQSTLSLAGIASGLKGNRDPMCGLEYSNDDEILDLVCHFEDDPETWEPGEGEASLTGAMMDGQLFQGSDVFDIVGKKKDKK